MTAGSSSSSSCSLEELLERVADEPRHGPDAMAVEVDPLLLADASAPPQTPWQSYANELRDLCRRVLEEADEKTAAGFWLLLVEMAARHGRHAGEWPA
jgi:hypothetical protein